MARETREPHVIIDRTVSKSEASTFPRKNLPTFQDLNDSLFLLKVSKKNIVTSSFIKNKERSGFKLSRRARKYRLSSRSCCRNKN